MIRRVITWLVYLGGQGRVINEFIIRPFHGMEVRLKARLEKPGKRNYKRLYLSHPNLRDFVQWLHER